MLLLSPPVLPEAPGCELIDKAHKIVSGPDGDGDYEISFRATVKNLRETRLAIRIIAQGIDEEDFAIYDMWLEVVLEPDETRVLHGLDYISKSTHDKVVKWDWLVEMQ
jgi:hypothetical protein